MKVLFVSSGNNKASVSTLVSDQGGSLKSSGVDVTYFAITGKGVMGYVKNIFVLRKYLKSTKFDIVHSHYSLSGFVAALAGAKPHVVSLMGSDVKQNSFWRIIIIIFNHFLWDACIVKTADMQKTMGTTNLTVIPNGVDISYFYAIPKEEAQKHLGWDCKKKHILFAADPVRKTKNFTLAENIYSIISNDTTELHCLNNVLKSEMPFYYSSSDVILLTSFWEGSPNVIKEAMACGRPVVATDVGDIKWLFGKTKGCYLISFDAADGAEKLKMAIDYSDTFGITAARERIINLGLDSDSISGKIIHIYNKVIEGKSIC